MAQPVQGQVVMAQQPVMAQPQMAQPQMMMAQPQQMVMMQQPGMVAPAGGVAVPPGAPPGGSRRLVKHCGMTSWIICLVANLCGVPICVCQLCCPCDQAAALEGKGKREKACADDRVEQVECACEPRH